MADKTGGLDPKTYQQAIKAVEELTKKQKALGKTMDGFKASWNGISSTIFGISGADWWEKVPKTTEELLKDAELIKEMESNLKGVGKTLDASVNDSIKRMTVGITGLESNLSGFANSFKGKSDIIGTMLKDASGSFSLEEASQALDLIQKKSKDLGSLSVSDREKLNKLIEKSKLDEEDITKMLEDSQKKSEEFYQTLLKQMPQLNEIEDEGMRKKFLISLANKDISGFLDEHQEKGLMILATQKQIYDDVADQADEYLKINKQVKEMTKELSKTEREVFRVQKGLEAVGKNIASGIIPKLLEFDKVIHDVQKNTGIMLTENAARMTELSIKTAEFGMDIQQTADFMGQLSEELRTTDFNVLSQAADDLKAIQLATGVSSENLSSMAGEMMRNGKSSKEVADAMADANVYAKGFGVSSKKVLDGMARNITKMRTMGFTGGEKSLMKMVATAERLRMNVDEIFDVAEKARNIEGAMEMAAELQLAGGSFANINPMDLLAASRKGPEELQKILTQMGGDIGEFNAKTGEMKFDPVDKDRLQIVADATGQTLDSMQKMITKNAQDNAKLNMMPDISFEGLTDKDGNPIDPDLIKNTLLDSVDMTGQALDGSVLDKAGIENLSEITTEQAEAIMRDQIEKDKNLEEQAKQNQGFQDALKAFANSFMNILTIFQPVIEALTAVLQWIIKNKWVLLIGALVALAAYMPSLLVKMGGLMGSMKKWLTSFAGMFKKGGISEMFKGGMAKKLKAPETGVKDDLANKIDKTDDLGSKANKVKGKSGLKTLAEGLKAMGNAKVFTGIGAVALAGPALLLFVPALPGLLVLAAVGAMDKLITRGFKAVAKGFEIMGKQMENILMGSLALFIVGAALIAFVYALTLLQGIKWETLAMAAVGMLVLVGALALIGPMAANPLLYMGALALVVVAAALAIAAVGLLIFAVAMQELAKVDWASFSGIGGALAEVAGGLALFALAGLLFLNPLMLIGMMLMIATLAAISIVLVPLAEALEMGGKGLDSMASGVLKLTESLGKLDFEKLEQLKEFSQSMALASLAGGAMSAMVSVVEAIGKIGSGGKGEGGSGGGTKTVVIQLKMPNGRVIEEHIVKDIDKAS